MNLFFWDKSLKINWYRLVIKIGIYINTKLNAYIQALLIVSLILVLAKNRTM